MRVISGIQATGQIHLGNYLGAIRHWVDMQDQHQCYYFLADLHAITVEQDPKDLKESIFTTVAALIASGVNPNDSVLFAQSHVKEHSELNWYLNCVTPIGWLGRMTQFKDKAGKNQESASCGLFTYPVLMAADILLYDADLVPVGEDQKQHLELTRDIALSVNRRFGKEIFKTPEPLIANTAVRIKSLKDGTKKMSKSDPSDLSRINLSDSKDQIISKIKKAKTDSFETIEYDLSRPEIINLLDIFAAFSSQNVQTIADEYKTAGYAKFKGDLAEVVAEKLSPINDEYSRLIKDKAHLTNILKAGAEKASLEVSKKISLVRSEFGFIDI